MVYMTKQEMTTIVRLIEMAEDIAGLRTADVTLDMVITDSNGETLGTITITDCGTYGFVPYSEDSEED